MICFLLHAQKWELAKKWMSDSANSENYSGRYLEYYSLYSGCYYMAPGTDENAI